MMTNGVDHEMNKSVLVLYATETGTSQDLAEEVGRCLERLRFDVVDVNEFDSATFLHLRHYSLIVFVISTTGQGDFPGNSRKFWTSLLKKKLTANTLQGVQFALVGLGDTSYPKFNFAARKLGKRLKQLGASEVVEPCECDEQGDDGTDGAFLEWMKRFRERILFLFPLRDGEELISETEPLPSKWQLQAVDHEDVTRNGVSPGADEHHSETVSDEFVVQLEQNDRVTPATHWQDVRFLRFCTSQPIEYLPGDALAISPQNMPEDVEALIQRLEWSDVADIPIKLTSSQPLSNSTRLTIPPISLPPNQHVTLRSLLTTHLDINAIPRRSFFGTLAHYTNDSTHKERLLEFTDPQFLDEYYDYATRPRRSISEILQEFHSVHIPWQEAINVFPRLRVRLFSIASGGNLIQPNVGVSNNGTTFELLVAIVKYRTVIKRIREGVCTRYLAQLPVGSKINVSLKTEGRFSKRREEIATRNHLLIGAGTGIAPLRALIHEKATLISNVQSSVSTPNHQTSISPPALSLPTTTLVFGARNKTADFFFSDEWSHLASSPSFSLNLITAFSRDQAQKHYIQNSLRSSDHHNQISQLLLDPNTTVVICGASGAMPKGVRQALVDVLCRPSVETKRNGIGEAGEDKEQKTKKEEQAEEFLVRMEKEGRYLQETWS